MHWARSCIRSAYLLSTLSTIYCPHNIIYSTARTLPLPWTMQLPTPGSCLGIGDSRGRGFQNSKSPTSRFCTIGYYLDRYVDSESEGECEMSCLWRCSVLRAEDLKGEYGQNCPCGPICQSFIILCCVNIRIFRGFSCRELGNILYYSTIRAKHHFGQIPQISNDTSKKSLTSLKNVDRFTIVPIFHIWCLYLFCFVSCGLCYGH